MLLYVTGSFPDSKEGIVASAKILIDSMVEIIGNGRVLLLTTDTPIITDSINSNALTEFELLQNWRINKKNIEKIYSILDSYQITAVHMEYPEDFYGKTFLASFLPVIIHRYNQKNKKSISVNVRLFFQHGIIGFLILLLFYYNRVFNRKYKKNI